MEFRFSNLVEALQRVWCFRMILLLHETVGDKRVSMARGALHKGLVADGCSILGIEEGIRSKFPRRMEIRLARQKEMKACLPLLAGLFGAL